MNLNSIVEQLQAEQQGSALKSRTFAAQANAAPAGGTGASGSANPASITANDFLTLLVTELQNQDPTANTDPNEYVNQLVSVNSLQQLISINQEVGGTAPPAAASSATAALPANLWPGAKAAH
jgi:flagellar basal-body rod modification protein FlgD